MKTVIAGIDIPRWLTVLESAIKVFLTDKNNHSFYMKIINVKKELFAFDFKNLDKNKYIDFDAIFKTCIDESSVDELFSEVIQILHKIIMSGEVDSSITISSLNILIKTVKESSYSIHSVNYTLAFISEFLKNIVIIQLKTLPVVGPLIDALEKTCTSLNKEVTLTFEKSKTIINEEISKTVDIKDFNGCLAYNNFANSLPLSTENSLDAKA